NAKVRAEVIAHYGGQCEICKESCLPFLQIDHLNGGGPEHLSSITGRNICVWLRQNKFPDGFRVLCANHNFALGGLSIRREHRQDTLSLECGEDICRRCKKNQAVLNRQLCPACADIVYGQQFAVRQRLRNEVLDHYGPVCVCCGQTNRDFLQVDHIDG